MDFLEYAVRTCKSRVFSITCFVEFGEQVHSTMPSPRFSAHCCSAEDGADN